jgi:hypothetical protein
MVVVMVLCTETQSLGVLQTGAANKFILPDTPTLMCGVIGPLSGCH